MLDFVWLHYLVRILTHKSASSFHTLKMVLSKELFDKIAAEAAQSPRLRKSFDLRDSEDEDSQRMLNVLLPGTKTVIHRHMDTSETVLCIYGSAIERFYDVDGNETECIRMKAGSDIPGIVVEKGRFHSLEASEELGVVCGVKAGHFKKINQEDIIEK